MVRFSRGPVAATLSLVLVASAAAPSAHADPWSGPGLGLDIGLAKGMDDVTEINGPRRQHLDTDGAAFGVRLGWDHRLDRWVVGGQLELGNLGQSGEMTRSSASDRVDGTVELGWSASLSARAGREVFPGWLAYGRFGVAVASLEARTSLSCPASPCSVTPSEAETRDHAFALLFGAGAEKALSDRWRLRLEYQYLDFRQELALPGSGPGWTHEIDTHVVKLGIDRKF